MPSKSRFQIFVLSPKVCRFADLTPRWVRNLVDEELSSDWGFVAISAGMIPNLRSCALKVDRAMAEKPAKKELRPAKRGSRPIGGGDATMLLVTGSAITR